VDSPTEWIGLAKQPPQKPAQDDGTWFLEAVGARAPSPTPIEAVEELTRENAIPELDSPVEPPQANNDTAPVRQDQIQQATFDGDPGTSTSTFAPIPEPPPPPTVLTSDTARPDTPEPEFDETLLSPALRTRRRFRWPVAIALITILVAIGVAAVWLPRAADQEALAIRQSNYDATLAVRSYLPPAQGALDAVTNPQSTNEQVDGAIPTISQLSSHASTLSEAAAIPLPTLLPFVPSNSLDALVPLQERSNILASETAEIARRLGHAYVYRTSIPQLLTTGDLATEASTQEINVVAVDLASSLADDAGVLGDLPSDPAFSGVAQAAGSAVERYARWQDEYLAALASGDTETATVLIDEIDALRDDLASITTAALVAFRTEMDGRILSLAGLLDEHLNDLVR